MFSAILTRLRSLKTWIEVVHLAVFISTLMKLPTLRVRSKTQQQKQIAEKLHSIISNFFFPKKIQEAMCLLGSHEIQFSNLRAILDKAWVSSLMQVYWIFCLVYPPQAENHNSDCLEKQRNPSQKNKRFAFVYLNNIMHLWCI